MILQKVISCKQLYKDLSECDDKAAILALQKEYSDKFSTEKTPRLLTDAYKHEFIQLSFEDLQEKSAEAFEELALTEAECAQIEFATRKQASSNAWYRYRAGRITASNLKSVVSTKPDSPSITVIKKVCYPESYSFAGNKATKWGLQKEKVALKQYVTMRRETHTNLVLEESGLCISTQYPFLGASPDSLVICDCCDKGCVEVKCPYRCFESPNRQRFLPRAFEQWHAATQKTAPVLLPSSMPNEGHWSAVL